MADFAAIIGTLGVCIQLTQGIVNYSAAFKHASEHAHALVTEVASVDHVLRALRNHLKQERDRGSNTFEQTSVLFFAVNGCQRRLQEIHDSLQPLASSGVMHRIWGRATWPFEKAGTTEAVVALHRFAQIFHFALSLEGFAALCQPQNADALAKIQSSLDTIEQNQANYNDPNIVNILDMVTALPALSAEVKMITQSIHQMTIDKEMTQLLDAIPRLPYSERHHNLQLTRLEVAGRWLLNTSEFLDWRNKVSDERTLWCNGAPGVGKTYLASVAIDHLQVFTARNDQAVLYFYFDYKLQSEQTPLRFIQTLLHQLLSTFSQVPPEALGLYQAVTKRKELPGWKELTSIFLTICNQSRDVFIVLDALDECDRVDNRGPIIDFIKDIKKSKARFMVTSRPYPADIDELLGRCTQILIEASDSDIRAYILDRIDRTPQVSRIIDTGLRDMIVESVASKSHGMFLLPALQMSNILGQTTKAQIIKALETLPTGLGENLLLTIERIKSQDPHSKTRATLALKILMWLSSARRPLTVRELQHAVATDPEGKRLGDITHSDFFVDCCFGLVIIDETSIIRLVHFSVSEFLEERREDLFNCSDPILATTCLSYMLFFVQSTDYMRNKRSSTRAYPDWPFLDYSIRYWAVHGKKDRSQNDNLPTFNLKAYEFCSSHSALKFWVRASKDTSRRSSRNENRDWFFPFKYLTSTLSKIHLASIYGLTSIVQHQVAKRPNSIGSRDENGATPLMLAAAGGYLDITELLMSNSQIDVNAQDKNGKTALWYAVDQEKWSIVRQMLNRTSDLDINLGGPFGRLCEKGTRFQGDELNNLISLFLTRDGLDVNVNNALDGWEPWYRLAIYYRLELLAELVAYPTFDPWRNGRPSRRHLDYSNYHKRGDYLPFSDMCDVPAITQLLDNDRRFDFCDFYALEIMWPFVYYAFADLEPAELRRIDWMDIYYDENQHWKYMVRDALKSRRISAKTTDSKGRSFLHYLARVGEDEDRQGHLEFLLKRLPTELKDEQGRTALHVAAESGHEHVIRQLLKAGADPLAIDEEGMSVLHYATKSNKIDLVRLLIEVGANVTAKARYGESLLHMATNSSNSVGEMIHLLIGLGVPIGDEDESGRTPLHVACYGSPEVFTALLEHGADPASWNCKRGTPLIDAVAENNAALTRLCLSKYKGDWNALDCYGMSVFDYLSIQKPSVAENLGFTPFHWSNYKPVEEDKRRRRVLQCLRHRLELMISSNDRNRKMLAWRTAAQLLKLGDDTAARIMLEADIMPESKSGSPYFPNDCCDVCTKDEGILFKCKTCPLKWICQECRERTDPDKGELPLCADHDLLQIPGDDWKNHPNGTVNQQGQAFGEWLVELREKYTAMD